MPRRRKRQITSRTDEDFTYWGNHVYGRTPVTRLYEPSNTVVAIWSRREDKNVYALWASGELSFIRQGDVPVGKFTFHWSMSLLDGLVPLMKKYGYERTYCANPKNLIAAGYRHGSKYLGR